MPIVSFLKSVFGIGSDSDDTGREVQNGDTPNTTNEAAVKGTDDAAAADTDAAASTGSVTEEPPEGKPDADDPVESAAEPAEAAAPESQVEGTEPAVDADADDEGDDTDVDAEAEAHAEGSASITEEPPADEGAAEPAEAAGAVTDHAGTDEDAAEPAEAAGPVDDEPETAVEEDPLTDVSGVGPAYASKLEEAGIETAAELAEADAAEVAESTGVSEKRVTRWIESAQDR